MAELSVAAEDEQQCTVATGENAVQRRECCGVGSERVCVREKRVRERERKEERGGTGTQQEREREEGKRKGRGE